VSNPAAV